MLSDNVRSCIMGAAVTLWFSELLFLSLLLALVVLLISLDATISSGKFLSVRHPSIHLIVLFAIARVSILRAQNTADKTIEKFRCKLIDENHQ